MMSSDHTLVHNHQIIPVDGQKQRKMVQQELVYLHPFTDWTIKEQNHIKHLSQRAD